MDDENLIKLAYDITKNNKYNLWDDTQIFMKQSGLSYMKACKYSVPVHENFDFYVYKYNDVETSHNLSEDEVNNIQKNKNIYIDAIALLQDSGIDFQKAVKTLKKKFKLDEFNAFCFMRNTIIFNNAISNILRINTTESNIKDNNLDSKNETEFWSVLDSLPNKNLFGTNKEIKHLSTIMQDGEILKAITSGSMDGKTWVIACTNMRVIFLDVGLVYRVNQMEIPIKNINSINQYRKIMFGEITIVDGSTTRKIENVDKNTIQFFIDKVNEQITSYINNGTVTTINNSLSNLDELKKLKELLDMEIITQEEFDLKKKELLGL